MPDGREPTAVNVLAAIAEVTAAEWDACAGLDPASTVPDNPFTAHGFLSALEESGRLRSSRSRRWGFRVCG